ncbi:MAG: hypothetical protein Q7S83_00250 [bacterium]|nr:hypothetical protein [bacterium]
MSQDQNPSIERHCTKENPWDHAPFDPTKETIIHNDAEETCPEYDGNLVPYRCPHCGHEFTVDMS